MHVTLLVIAGGEICYQVWYSLTDRFYLFVHISVRNNYLLSFVKPWQFHAGCGSKLVLHRTLSLTCSIVKLSNVNVFAQYFQGCHTLSSQQLSESPMISRYPKN